MELERSFRPEEIESRGAVCVECAQAVAESAALSDRCGATLCRACASGFYVACGSCGGLIPRDEALERTDLAGALLCPECFRAPSSDSGAETLPTDAEAEEMAARFLNLHAEKKRIDAEIEDIKERLKLFAGARPRVGNAVVLRAGDGGVRCSYSVRTSWDAERLSAVERILGEDAFSSLFERKISFKEVRDRLEEFMNATNDGRDEARELLRSAAQTSETATLNVIAPRKRKGSEDA